MSVHKVVEKVPTRFIRRNGDWVQEGGNNTLLVMGTDRAAAGPASVDDGLGTVEAEGGGRGTGVIHATVGRKQNDPDFATDDAFFYLAMKTDADANLKSDGLEEGTSKQPAGVLKSTDVRIVFGGPGSKGNLKIYLDVEHKDRYLFMNKDRAVASMADDSRVVVTKDDITALVGSNVVKIERNGTISVLSNEQVHIKTKSVNVDCSDATVNASTTTVNSPTTSINGSTVDIKGTTTVEGSLTVVGPVTVGGASIQPGGSISAPAVSAGGIDFGTHTHNVPNVKGGDSTVTSAGPQ